jgi:hypothetical protein
LKSRNFDVNLTMLLAFCVLIYACPAQTEGFSGTLIQIDSLRSVVEGDSNIGLAAKQQQSFRLGAHIHLFSQGELRGESVDPKLTRLFPHRKENGLFIQALFIRVTHDPHIQFDTGALPQKEHASRLLVDDLSFFGLRQTWTSPSSSSVLRALSLQQAVPVGHSWSESELVWQDLPLAFSGSGLLQKNSPFGLQARLSPGFYSFSNSAQKIKDLDCRIGTLACANGERSNDGLGLDLYSDLIWSLPQDASLQISLQGVHNFLSDQDSGALIEARVTKTLNSSLSLTTSAEYFFKESNIGPSFYAPFLYGPNQQGFVLNFGLLTLDKKLRTLVQYAELQNIRNSSSVSRSEFQLLYFSLEASPDPMYTFDSF